MVKELVEKVRRKLRFVLVAAVMGLKEDVRIALKTDERGMRNMMAAVMIKIYRVRRNGLMAGFEALIAL
jgi:hypothetical protein